MYLFTHRNATTFVFFFSFGQAFFVEDALPDYEAPKVTAKSIYDLGKDLVDGAAKRLAQSVDAMRPTYLVGGLDTNQTFFGTAFETVKREARVIYPGTLWCGQGTKARSFNELGSHEGTDKCCRQHDMCPINMEIGESKFNLTNPGLFTRSHCDCDFEFYACLKKTNTTTSNRMGYTYFNVLGPQCFQNSYKIKECTTTILGRCMKYSTETSGEKTYQWFDNPLY